MFNGGNMITATNPTTIKALATRTPPPVITVSAQICRWGSTALTGISATSTIGTVTTATAMIATVNTAIGAVSSALSKLGTGSKALASHATFIQKLQDTIDAGVGNLVDADLAKESAKLQALQTKQQLGVQALSIANQSSSILLGLFR